MGDYTQGKTLTAVSKQLTGMEQMWSEKARANYERARQLADEARGLVK